MLSVFGNTLWSAYAHKIDNMDLEIPSMFGWFVSLMALTLYITVDCDPKQATKGFLVALIASAAFTPYLPAQLCGIAATSLSIMTSISTLEQIPLVVQSRNPSFINFPLVSASLCSSFIWTLYAVLNKDMILTAS